MFLLAYLNFIDYLTDIFLKMIFTGFRLEDNFSSLKEKAYIEEKNYVKQKFLH